MAEQEWPEVGRVHLVAGQEFVLVGQIQLVAE